MENGKRCNGRSVIKVIFILSILILSILGSSSFFQKDDSPVLDTEAAPVASSNGLHNQADLLLKISGVEGRTQSECASRDTLIEYNGTYFYIYTWTQGSVVTVSLIASSDGGGNWSSKVDLWNSTYYTYAIFKQLLVWKGDLYAFYSGWRSSYSNNRVYMKKAPVSSWTNIRSSQQVTISSSNAHNFEIVSDENYLYMAMVYASQWFPRFFRYNGISWSSPVSLDSSGTGGYCDIELIKMGSTTKIMVFYARQGGTGNVYMKYSLNGGGTWSSRSTVMSSTINYGNMRCENVNGTLILIAGSSNNNDDLDICISRDNGTTWSNEKQILSTRGTSSRFYSNACFSLGERSNGRIQMLAYEGNPEETQIIYSKDWGSNWISESQEITVHTPGSFDPVISDDGKMMACTVINGSSYDSILIDISELFLDDFAPMNLSLDRSYFHMNLSWERPTSTVLENYTFQNFTIYRGLSPLSMSSYMSVGNVTWYNDTVISLEPQDYYYAVSATYSSIGESDLSNIASGSLLIPSPISGLTAVPGDLQVTLNWNAIPEDVVWMFPITHFSLYRGEYYDSMHPFFILDPDDRSFIDTTVSHFPSTYHYSISYSIAGIGEMEMSNIATASPFTFPDPPLDVHFEEIDGGVNIEWEPPMNDGGYPVEEYSIYRGNSADDMLLVQIMYDPAKIFHDLNLTMGEKYFFSVSSSNRLGESLHSDPVLVEYRTAPSSPLSFEGCGDNGLITLDWDPPGVDWGMDIEFYRLYRAGPGEEMGLRIQLEGGIRTFSDPVANGIQYRYWISAVNDFGEGGMTGPVSAKGSTIPGQISGISAAVYDSRVRLRWGEMEDDGGSSITRFNIYRAEDEDDTRELVGSVNGVREFFDTGVFNGIDYYYWISAVNNNGEGPISEPVLAVPGADPFMINEVNGKGMLFSARIWWDHPEDGGSAITSYRLYRGSSIHSIEHLVDISYDRFGESYYLDTDLESGLTYYYAVTAVNYWGESARSPIIPVVPLGFPGQPVIEHLSRRMDGFSLSWKPPVDTGGLPIQGHQILYREVDDDLWMEIETATLDMTVNHLNIGYEYEVKVSSFNQLGPGEPSDPWFVRIGSVPDMITEISAGPGDGTVTLSWLSPESNGFPILGYRVFMMDDREDPVMISEVGPEIREYLKTGLFCGIAHRFKIAAINEVGQGYLSQWVSATPLSVPDPVQMIWTTEEFMGNVNLQWKEPENTGGTEILGYSIYRGSKEEEGTLVGSVSRQTFFHDTGLVDGQEYYYRISATNEVGEGSKSVSFSAFPVGLPSMVRDLSVIADTDTVEISWIPPENDGGANITGYIVFKGTDPLNMRILRFVQATEVKIKDEDVKEGTYHYKVVARNAIGTGEASSLSIDVPSRTGTAILIAASAFFIPLIIILLAVLLPILITRSRRSKKEREAKEAIERNDALKDVSTRTGPKFAGYGTHGGSQLPPLQRMPRSALGPASPSMKPSNALPPMKAAPRPPAQIIGSIRSGVQDSPSNETRSFDPVDVLTRLNEMKEKGIISEEEYRERKNKVLDNI